MNIQHSTPPITEFKREEAPKYLQAVSAPSLPWWIKFIVYVRRGLRTAWQQVQVHTTCIIHIKIYIQRTVPKTRVRRERMRVPKGRVETSASIGTDQSPLLQVLFFVIHTVIIIPYSGARPWKGTSDQRRLLCARLIRNSLAWRRASFSSAPLRTSAAFISHSMRRAAPSQS